MISQIVGPVLVSVDQFVIGATLGAVAVAHYSIAYSLAVKLLILPTAVAQTLFPRLAVLDPVERRTLADLGSRINVLVMATLCIPAIVLARPFFSFWISPEFGASSGPVAAILLFSVVVNGAAFFPFVLLQAEGRPGVASRFHLLEIVPFFIALWAGIHFMGLLGAALAWGFRVTMDAALLYAATRLRATFVVATLSVILLVAAATITLPMAGVVVAIPTTLWFGHQALREIAPHVAGVRKLLGRYCPRVARPKAFGE